MSDGSARGLSRGDRRRNEKLAQLREIVTRSTAVLAFDLAADKQVCALTDPDSRVLARRTVRVKAWQLHKTVAWGLRQAARAGFASVVVACEPTGHRWRVLDQIAAGVGVRLVCVQLSGLAPFGRAPQPGRALGPGADHGQGDQALPRASPGAGGGLPPPPDRRAQ